MNNLTNQSIICIEKQCILNRTITNWDQLQEHLLFSHEITSLDKFKNKVQQQYTQSIQQQTQYSLKQIEELYTEQEQLIIQHIRSLFQTLKMTQIEIFKSKLINPPPFQNFTFDGQLEIYHQTIQLIDTNTIINEFAISLQKNVQDVRNNLKLLENQFIQQNQETLTQQSDNNVIVDNQENQNFQVEQYFLKRSSDTTYQQNNIHDEQFSRNQQFYQQQDPFFQQYEKNYTQIEQPLKGYREIVQRSKIQPINSRINFQMPSEYQQFQQNNNQENDQIFYPYQYQTSEDNSQSIQSIQNQEIDDNTAQQQLSQKQNSLQESTQDIENSESLIDAKQINDKKLNIKGKKFDLNSSDKHLKYGSRFSLFSCNQWGAALVEGMFSLMDNAKVRFKFSNYIDKTGMIQVGIMNVDKQGQKVGTIKFFLDQSGSVYKNESQRTGSLKLNVGDDISLGYRGEKRLLMFRMGDIAEYIHIDKNYSGNYKFFVKIYGLQVQIL